MTPIERAARALAYKRGELQERFGASHLTPALAADRYWRDHIADVRAVLQAIREPDGDMINAGQEAPSSEDTGIVWPVGIYQAMIDKALEEG